MLPLTVVALYLTGLLAVGVVKSRQVDGQAGFILAGRGLGPLVLVGTLLATWTGTGTVFGSAEEAYRVGLPALVLPLASVSGILLLFVMAPRVRARGRFTLQDLLEERFGPIARVLATLTLVLAYLVIVSYQLRAASAVLDGVVAQAGLTGGLEGLARALQDAGAALGLDLPLQGGTISLALVALFVGAYTALAGMMSVALTDALNGLIMIAGVACALPLVWSAGGGVEGVLAALPEAGRALGGPYNAFDYLSILLPAFLLVLGDANLHQRFLSARSDGTARLAAALLVPGVLLVDGLVILLAIGGRAVVPGLEEAGEAGHVVLELALLGGASALPPLLGALLVASILAMIVSTADSFLLSCASSLTHDVWLRFVDRRASEARLLRVARLLVVLLMAAAFALTFTSDAFFEISLFAYTLYGVGITPVLLAALFWRRATPAGAVASMLSATGFAIAWNAADLGARAAAALGQPVGTRLGAVVPAILVAALVLVGVSLATRPGPADEEARVPLDPAGPAGPGPDG